MSLVNAGVREESNTGVKELVDKNRNSKEEKEILGSDKMKENVGSQEVMTIEGDIKGGDKLSSKHQGGDGNS